MVTLISSACALAFPRQTRTAAAATRLRRVVHFIGAVPLAGERRVDDRELFLALREVDAGDAEHAAELGVLDLHRAGRGGSAGRGLREGGGAGGVERDGA